MRKYFSIIIALLIVALAAYFTLNNSNDAKKTTQRIIQITNPDIGTFGKQTRCGRPPKFLKQKGIPQPVLIDLSQKHHQGIALLYGNSFKKTLHPKEWGRFEHFGTYALDRDGNIYLAPMPYISITPSTFLYQTNIYKLDSKNAELSVWMHLDNILPGANNPFGVISLVFDCDDQTLWVSAIDKSDYRTQKGRIYHIDIKSKSIIDTYDGFDALTLSLLHTNKGKYLLAGSARDNSVYAFSIAQKSLKAPVKLFSLPESNMHVRKIKVRGNNTLELQAIPFTYTLIVQTDTKDRMYYRAEKSKKNTLWNVNKVKL